MYCAQVGHSKSLTIRETMCFSAFPCFISLFLFSGILLLPASGSRDQRFEGDGAVPLIVDTGQPDYKIGRETFISFLNPQFGLDDD